MVYINDPAHIILLVSCFITLVTILRLAKILSAWWDAIVIYIFFGALILQVYNGPAGSFAGALAITSFAFAFILVVVLATFAYCAKHATQGLIMGLLGVILLIGVVMSGPLVLLPWVESELGISVSFGVFVGMVAVMVIILVSGFYASKQHPWIAARVEELVVSFICSLSIDVLVDVGRDGLSDFSVLSFDWIWALIWSLLWVVYNTILGIQWYRNRESAKADAEATEAKEKDYQRLLAKEAATPLSPVGEDTLMLDDFPEALQIRSKTSGDIKRG